MDLNVVLAAVGGTLLSIGLLARVVQGLWLSGVLLALLIGVVLGPDVSGLIDPSAGTGEPRKLLEEVARVTLAIALMATGLHVTRDDLRSTVRSWSSLLTVGMVGMWVLTGLGAYLLLDLPFWVGFTLGAVLTPTDPVVAAVIVTGPLAERHLPRRLRRTLQIESGANDGLALPFVLVAAYLATGRGTGEALLESLQQVVIAVAVGAATGWAVGRVAELSRRHHESDEAHLLGLGIALALLSLGLVHLLGGSGVLASFVAALSFSATLERRDRESVGGVQEAVAKFFTLPAFMLLGTLLPFDGWVELGWPGLLFVLWVLLVRRPPVVPLALLGSSVPRHDRAFLAWFGPLGVAAVFYATFIERFALPEYERVFAAATLAICASVVAHSLTATPSVQRHPEGGD